MTAGIVRMAAEDQWLGVDWGMFAIVFVVTLAAGLIVVSFYALALRLLATGAGDDETRTIDGTTTTVAVERTTSRPAAATLGAYACLAVSAASVLFGLWLLIPQFH